MQLADPKNNPFVTFLKRVLPLPVKQALRVLYLSPLFVRSFGLGAGVTTVAKLIIGRGEHTAITLPDIPAPLIVRNHSSDVGAFGQVFLRGSYAIPLAAAPEFIIDGGANIGCASVYFANRFPDARIVAVEPDRGNFRVLEANAAAYPNITPVLGAIWSHHASLALQNPEDEGWKLRVEERAPEHTIESATESATESTAAGAPVAAVAAPADQAFTVQAYTVDDLLALSPAHHADILKLDVEGAEKQIFAGDTAWLEAVDTIVIEVHDRLAPGASAAVQAAIAADFVIVGQWGENFVAQRC